MALQNQRQHLDPVRIFGRRVFLLALLVMLFFGSLGAWSAYQKEQESHSMRMAAESERADLEKRQAHLEQTIAELSTDRGREAAVRERYMVAKKGEGIIIIVDPTPKPQPATTSPWYVRLKWW